MKKIGPPDQHHLEAAQGWLGLGNHQEASEELERIRPRLRSHPDVLRVRWEVYARATKWELAAEVARTISDLLPDSMFGWVHLAYALHELKHTREAREVLLPVVDKFPREHILSYNLACYCCQLGNQKEAWQWLEKAIALAGKKDIPPLRRAAQKVHVENRKLGLPVILWQDGKVVEKPA